MVEDENKNFAFDVSRAGEHAVLKAGSLSAFYAAKA